MCCVSIFVCLKILFYYPFNCFFDPLVFRRMLLNFHVLMSFPVFLPLLIYGFIPLWAEKIFGIISIFLNLLRHVLWPNRWSILENILCAFDKNVYSSDVRQNVLYSDVNIIAELFCLYTLRYN